MMILFLFVFVLVVHCVRGRMSYKYILVLRLCQKFDQVSDIPIRIFSIPFHSTTHNFLRFLLYCVNRTDNQFMLLLFLHRSFCSSVLHQNHEQSSHVYIVKWWSCLYANNQLNIIDHLFYRRCRIIFLSDKIFFHVLCISGMLASRYDDDCYCRGEDYPTVVITSDSLY